MHARFVAVLIAAVAAPAIAQTSFTYQGRLSENGQAANGAYDLDFRLIDLANAGNEVSQSCRVGVPVLDGLFSTAIDLGPISRDYTYSVRVRARRSTGLGCDDQTGFTTLQPDQILGATPRAIHALNASSLSSPDGSPATALQVGDEGTLIAYGNLQVNGGIGLGTFSPTGRLDMRSNDSGFFRFMGTSEDIQFNGGTDGAFGFFNVGAGTGRTDFINGGAVRLSVGNNGRVGINTNNPGKTLTVAGDMELGTGAGDYRHLRLGGGNSSGFLYGAYPRFDDGIHLGYNYYANAAGNNVIANTGGGTSRLTCGYGFIQMVVGNVNSAPNTVRLEASTSGVTVFGTFNNSSDRNAKQDFKPIDTAAMLAKVVELPLSEWSYKEDAAIRHIGPMAQDFHATFGIGTDDTHIAPLDEGGIAFAAIQGLNEKLAVQLEERDEQIAELTRELAELKTLVHTLAFERATDRR